MDFLQELSLVPIIVIIVVAIALLGFLLAYFIPGYKVYSRLGRSTSNIRIMDRELSKDKAAVESQFTGFPRLLEIWKKYSETLHPQFRNVDGQRVLQRLRATVPAESFFNKEVLVDTPLHTDFFKHLPGILTGVGIIGTFYGLITGLQHFNVDTDAEALQRNLAALLMGVREAFIASGIAIFVAILITGLEKFTLNLCYRRTDEFVQLIDTLYEAGAGEEYLSRLVESSEESAAQTRLLKDSLVNDLKELLTNFSDSLARSIEHNTQNQTSALIESHRAEQELFRESLAEAVKNSLDGPMQSISEVTRTIGGNQGEAINDLLSVLIAKLEDTFGGQMRGLNELMSNNAGLMDGMQQRFSAFVDKLEHSGKSAQEAQSEHLRTLMEQAEQRQQEMNEQVSQSLEKLSSTVSTLMEDLAQQRNAIGAAGQEGLSAVKEGLACVVEELRITANKTSEMFNTEIGQVFATVEKRQSELNDQMSRLMEQMELRREEQDRARIAADQERAERLESQANVRYEELGTHLRKMADTIQDITVGISQSVMRLEKITIEGATSLKQEANAVRATAEALSNAGVEVSRVLTQASTVEEKLGATAKSMERSATALSRGMEDYQRYREQVESMLQSLRVLLLEAEKRHGLSKSLLDDMNAMVGQARELQREANLFLAQSGEVLKEGFNSFADAVTTNMSKSRAEFDKGMGQAVEMISGQIHELENVLDQLVRSASGRRS